MHLVFYEVISFWHSYEKWKVIRYLPTLSPLHCKHHWSALNVQDFNVEVLLLQIYSPFSLFYQIQMRDCWRASLYKLYVDIVIWLCVDVKICEGKGTSDMGNC